MPRGNGTGPMGMGPMTGRGAGFCAGYNVPGFISRTAGMGCGMRRVTGFGTGGGYGFRNRFYATGLTGWQRSGTIPAPVSMSRKEELETLKKQAEFFEKNMREIHDKIARLETEEKA